MPLAEPVRAQLEVVHLLSDEHVITMEKNCVATGDSSCSECDLCDTLICRFEKRFANKFTLGNTLYRVIALAVLFLAGIMVNQPWLMPVYLLGMILIFFIFEPRLLCSHCPFYEKEGKFLHCWALRGMPKLWKYRPGPITRSEKTAMLVLGAFIDLFPLVGIGWGLVEFMMYPARNVLLGSLLVILSILFIVVMVYFAKVLLGYTCHHCPNFSCAMNKVPPNIVTAFLNKNLTMKKAWEETGWTPDS